MLSKPTLPHVSLSAKWGSKGSGPLGEGLGAKLPGGSEFDAFRFSTTFQPCLDSVS